MKEMKMKKKMFLEAEAILRYLLDSDDNVDTLVTCKSTEVDLMTSVQALYAALGSVEDRDNFKLNKLIKLLEVTKFVDNGRKVLTHEFVDELRTKSFNKIKDNNI